MTIPQISKPWYEYFQIEPTIGQNCSIHPTASIGQQGFGIIRDKETGIPSQLPHKGGVIIGDNVRIGACTCIDRATNEDNNTIIGNNVMIDNLVHIAHNCRIGDGTIIVAGTVVGGTCMIGKNCFIGENVSILQHTEIGDEVIVGAGTVVTKDIGYRDVIVGVPARSIRGNTTMSEAERFRMVGY